MSDSVEQRGPTSRKERRRLQRQQPPPPVEDPKRRKLILGGLGATLLAAVGWGAHQVLNPPEQPHETSIYKDWKNYANKTFPREKVIAIGEDLERDTFQGFSEVGSLIKRLQTNPKELQKYIPLYDRNEIITLGLADFVRKGEGIGSFGGKTNFDPIKVDIFDQTTNRTIPVIFPKVRDISEVSVLLDNGFIVAPDAAKKLLLVKEFAHLLYMQQHREFIRRGISKKFQIDASVLPDWDAHLYEVAIHNITFPEIDFGDEYNNAWVDLDIAAHFHIVPALGQMKDAGLLSNFDLGVLEVNFQIFRSAQAVGLLRKTGGAYVWKEGIGPFSQEWLELARPLWKLKAHGK